MEEGIKLLDGIMTVVRSTILVALIIMGLNLYSDSKKEEWNCFKKNVAREAIKLIIIILGIVVVSELVKNAFGVSMFTMLDIRKNYRMIFSAWLIVATYNGKKRYDAEIKQHDCFEVRFNDENLETITNRYLGIMDSLEVSIKMQQERMNILKGVAPISVIPLVAGYVLEGKMDKIDWNWCTVILFIACGVYVYNLWSCYNHIKYFEFRRLGLQREMREYRTKNNKQGDS